MSEEQDAQQQEFNRQLALIAEKVLVHGDLSVLTPQQRHFWYINVCESLGLNWKTRPFEYITVGGKMVLYARRDATDQLRKIHKVSVEIKSRELVGDVFIVTARAETPDGRKDESVGAVFVSNLRGEALANAYMKAETKAKRRVALSIVGLGWMDESEAETMQQMAAVPQIAAPKKKNYEDMTDTEKIQVLAGVWGKRWQEADKKGLVEKWHLHPLSVDDVTLEKMEAIVKAIGELLKASSEEEVGEAAEKLHTYNAPISTEQPTEEVGSEEQGE